MFYFDEIVKYYSGPMKPTSNSSAAEESEFYKDFSSG